MATKLKNMKLTSVDLVRAGANQEADIGLFKSAGPQAVYDEALVKSARSILEDPDLAEDQQAGMLAKSVDDYRAALEEPEDEPEGEEVMVEKELEEENLADLDEIEEVEKYNHNHAADGKFSSSPGSGGGASGGLNAKVKALLSGDSGNKYKVGALVDEMKVGDRVKVHNHKKNEDYEFEKLSDRDTIGAFQNVTGKNHMASPAHVKGWVQDDVLNGGVPSFTEKAEKGMDEIEEVEKNYDTIEEVQKFNPFHDSLGRFASSNSFRTYSANPKSKAGAMAIGRSARAGHTSTMNVHTESKGENIGQNYTWLQTGQKPAFLTSGSSSQQTPPPPPVPKPKRTRKPKAQQQTQQNPPQTTPSTPTLDKEAKGVSLTAADSQALQMRTRMGQPANTIQAAKDHDQARVPGQDITATVDVSTIKVERGGRAIDAVAKAQGWDKAPAVTNDKDLFDKMAMKSGRVLIRTVGDDARSNQTARDVARTTMTSGTTPLGGTGLKAYGEGLYMVSTSLKAGTGSMDSRVRQGQRASYSYGSTQMMATVHPKARIATATKARQLIREYHNLSSSDQARFGFSQNAYIAAKGFDGVQWHESRNPGAYATIFNKSALVFYGETNR